MRYNFLSFDIAGGGLVGMAFMAKFKNISLSFPIYFGLFISIWLIYNFDHILDIKAKVFSKSSRRYFFQKHSHSLKYVLGFGFLLGFLNLFFLPYIILKYGLILTLGVGFYFFMLSKLSIIFFFQKEFTGALLYTIGIFLPIQVSGKNFLDLQSIHVVLLYFILAFQNIMLFAYFESEQDRYESQISWTSHINPKRAYLILTLIFILGYLEIALAKIYITPSIWIILFIMFLILSSLFVFSKFFKIKQRYRLIGDAVFYIPIIYLVI